MKRSRIKRIAWWLLVPVTAYLTLDLIVAVLSSNLDRVYAAVVCLALVCACISYLRWLRRVAWTPVEEDAAADDDAHEPQTADSAKVATGGLYSGLINRDVSETTVWL